MATKKISDFAGLCRLCTRVSELPSSPIKNTRNPNYKRVLCGLEKHPCYLVRNSLYTCEYFDKTKPRSTIDSLIALLKALWISFKQNSWTPLKEAVKNELQS